MEPIAQIIARPDEAINRRSSNEDAQSLVFDDRNLFSTDQILGL